jgi:hypothetical protein
MIIILCKKQINFLCKLFLTGSLSFLFLAGCELYGKIGEADENIEGSLPELLRGEWVYTQPGSSTPAERYVIEIDTIQYGYGGGESDSNYKGYIRFVSNYSANSGVIIIEYVEPPYYQGYNGNSFCGVYYRNLKNDTVQLANAINLEDLSSADTATLEAAIKKFTNRQMGNYVDWGVVQPQKRVLQ